mmetsp:Transcript_11509/g.20409  ORF Transcript_11509/g.20409 Transcript_11509/m.20409 type:complete len:340 (-) Transcript_11509:325-1344(-)
MQWLLQYAVAKDVSLIQGDAPFELQLQANQPTAKPTWQLAHCREILHVLLQACLRLDATVGTSLLLAGLEATVTELGGGIDELELDLLQGIAAGLGDQAAAQSDSALLATWHGALDHEEVLLDHTILHKATHGSDVLLGHIKVCGCAVAGLALLAYPVDLLVDLRAMEEAHLSGAGNSPLDTSRVPRTNASHLTQTTMGLARQTGHTPALHHTLSTVTLGDSNGVDHLVALEDGVNRHLLLEQAVGEVDLLGDVTTVDLNLHEVSLLLAEAQLLDLGVSQHTDDNRVLLQLLQLGLDLLLAVCVLLGILGESLLLGLAEVLVELALDLITQVLSPHSVQ